MKHFIFGIFVSLVCALAGCDDGGLVGGFDDTQEYRWSRESKAMSLLKRYQTAASISQVETGQYPTLPELYEEHANERLISEAFFKAWDGHEQPVPLEGYLYSTIDTDESGAPLERTEYAGLCAYPAVPGKSGDLIICILADPAHFKIETIDDYGAVSHGEEWTYYTARYETLGEPPRRWPSDLELRETFRALEKRTPEEGLKQAQQLLNNL